MAAQQKDLSADQPHEEAPRTGQGIGRAWQADATARGPRCPVCGRGITVRHAGDESGWSCSGGHSGLIGG